MIIAPFNTDAPLYHRPLGTLGLIAVNVAVWLAFSLESLDPYALHYGHGLTPVQWLTSNFVHGDLIHLAGNMFFLWGFGLIIEGKLGWQRFIALYLAIGVLECALEQVLFLRESGVSLGASSAIFGLMAIALLWAPKNELSVFYWILLKTGVTDISVLLFSGLLLLKSLLFVGFTGVTPSTEVLHLLGALFGLLFGLLFLWFQWVDCEGWDLLSVLRGQRRELPLLGEPLVKKKVSHHKRDVTAEPQTERLSAVQKFSQLLEQNKPHAAHSELRHIRSSKPNWTPLPQELLALARGLRKLRDWKAALSCYKEYLHSLPQIEEIVRIEIAEVLVLVTEQPQAALNVLSPVVVTALAEPLQLKVRQLRERAETSIAEGTLEVRDDGWKTSADAG